MVEKQIEGAPNNITSLKLHDAEIAAIHFSEETDKTYTITLNLRILGRRIEGKYERNKINLIFKKCVFLASNIDLLFFMSCKGAIEGVSFYEDFSLMEAEKQQIFQKYLTSKKYLIEKKGWYHIQLVQPSGEIIIGSNYFEIEEP